MARMRQRYRISHDALFNLHELSYDLDMFVHKIVTYPDLIVICGIKRMLMEVNKLLQLKETTNHQVMSYDTLTLIVLLQFCPCMYKMKSMTCLVNELLRTYSLKLGSICQSVRPSVRAVRVRDSLCARSVGSGPVRL